MFEEERFKISDVEIQEYSIACPGKRGEKEKEK